MISVPKGHPPSEHAGGKYKQERDVTTLLIENTHFLISVYCACCLGNHNIENRLTDRHITPHFYVNVADIETLETEMAYIACKYAKFYHKYIGTEKDNGTYCGSFIYVNCK